MSTLTFLLPADFNEHQTQELVRAYIAGGMDGSAAPTEVRIEQRKLIVSRAAEESGSLVVPWEIDGRTLALSTATLIERPEPYHLVVELARGKVNQLRCQAADWEAMGLQVSPPLAQRLHELNTSIARTLASQHVSEQADPEARQTLNQAIRTGEEFVEAYIDQVLQARRRPGAPLTTSLGCRLGSTVPDAQQTQFLRQAFNTIRLAFSWPEIEPSQADYHWDAYDAVVSWAKENGFVITGGPLIDFSAHALPDWLWLWEKDLQSLAGLMCDYVRTVLVRYGKDIRVWQLTAASNGASTLSLQEDALFWLTARLLEAGKETDPNLKLVVGIAQPWGEYLIREDRTHSPVVLAESFIRNGLSVAGFELEFVTGIQPRASYRRDLLELSRLLDGFSFLGLPIMVTLGCPSRTGPDPQANALFQTDNLCSWTPESQADWAARCALLAVAKPYVEGVDWVHFSDADPHVLPHCGLLDVTNQPKPVLEQLRRIREQHLQ